MAFDRMQKSVWSMFGQQLAKLPPEARQAMAQLKVGLRRDGRVIEIVAAETDDPAVEKVRDVLFSELLKVFPLIIAGFGVQVKVPK